MKKRHLSFLEIWNLSFGFLGIQMGFALQNANASSILSRFGAEIHTLSLFWLVAPITGLIVQPVVGHYSDKTWNRLGRRKPYFLAGALLASIGMVLLPQSAAFIQYLPVLWFGAGFLMLMDASFNIAMEPFRAFVADLMPADQRTLGFSIQTILIGLGAVVGSFLPYILSEWFGVSDMAEAGHVPLHIQYSFIIGAVILVMTVIVTIVTTREYSPDELAQMEEHKQESEPESTSSSGFVNIITDLLNMPKTMRQLALVQFFSWFGLFGMWVFTTRAIAQHVYHLPLNDTSSALYSDAEKWTGVIFAIYNGVSALVAFFLPAIAHKIGRKNTHMTALIIGGLGLISIYFAPDKYWLIPSMIGLGFAWASILAMPYAILSGALPTKKIGVYMGIFNFFIVLPQILNGLIGGWVVEYIYGGNAVFALVTSGVSLLIAAVLVVRVEDKDDPYLLKKSQSR